MKRRKERKIRDIEAQSFYFVCICKYVEASHKNKYTEKRAVACSCKFEVVQFSIKVASSVGTMESLCATLDILWMEINILGNPKIDEIQQV